MTFFAVNTFKRSEGGQTANWNNYNERQVLIDEQYKDPFGNITSEEYFEKSRQNIDLAMSQGVSEAKVNTLSEEKLKLSQDQNNFTFTNSPILGNGIDELKADIQDTWRNIWSNKDLLATGNFGVMAQGMEAYLAEQREQAIQFRDELNEVSEDFKMIDQVDSIIELYTDSEKFYRGAAINPEEYRVDMNTNSRGQISDVTLKNVNESSSGFFDTNQKDPAGISIYSKPHKAYEQEDGTKGFAIGNAQFSGDSSSGFFADNNTAIEFSSVVIEDPINAAPGTLVKAPDGQVYGKNDDGTYFKFDGVDVKNFGFDENNIISASRKTIDDINRNFEVIDANSEFVRRKEITQRNQAQLDELLKNDPGRLSPLEQVTVEPIRRRVRAGVSLFKQVRKFTQKPIPQKVLGFAKTIAKSTPPVQQAVAIKEAAKFVAGKAGSLFNRARGFFRDITEAPDTKIK